MCPKEAGPLLAEALTSIARLAKPHSSAAAILGDELDAGGFESCLNGGQRRRFWV